MEEPTVAELSAMVVGLRSELSAMRSEMAAARADYEQRIAELEAENAALRIRVVELETQLRTNSRNSSKPPSSDGPAKAAPRSLRRKSGRKPGGQQGHQASTLRQVSDPDVVVRHDPVCCRSCGSDLTTATEVGCSRRQVFDIPPVKVAVTEHQVITRRCRCGKTTSGAPPAGATAPVQYGPMMCAVIIYLFMGQFLSKKRTAQAIGELFGIPVSDGTVAAVTARAAPVVNFDETGLRCEGRNAWLHSASTPSWSLLFAHHRRGVQAMNQMGVLPTFTGTAVHDAWAPYDTYTGAGHALCNALHLSHNPSGTTVRRRGATPD